jgi:hypothetical protein
VKGKPPPWSLAAPARWREGEATRSVTWMLSSEQETFKENERRVRRPILFHQAWKQEVIDQPDDDEACLLKKLSYVRHVRNLLCDGKPDLV